MTAAGADPARGAAAYDGVPATSLAARLGLPAVHAYASVTSTMDIAHALAAEGAPAGTAVVADTQVAGRGRQGRSWSSGSGQGVWVTLVERPRDAAAIEVLSLRAGLLIAEALEPMAPSPIQLKWPNDLHVAAGKLAGILIEARWRDGRLDWLAVGVGLNVRPPAGPPRGALRPGTDRVDALAAIVAGVRVAATATGALTAGEVARFHARDLAVGRVSVAPSAGVVAGIDATGAIIIDGPDGARAFRTGSLVLAEDA